MEDKELIELAAKAAGFGDPEGNFIWTESEYPRGSKTSGALWNYMGWCDTAQLWNPLTDDGDALRLAVTLDIFFRPEFALQLHEARYNLEDTRRAIVRAAAQIGKEME